MFNIYIKDFNKNGQVIGTETLIQTVPADSVDKLRFISPIVKCEMGKVEGFDFSIEPGTPFYDAFLQMKTFIRVTYDGETIFYGRVLTIDNSGFRGTRKVRCEGPLSFLMDSPVEGVEETKRKTVTTLQYIQQLIANHNSYINNEANKCFAVGNVPGNYSGVNSEQQIKNDSRTFGSDSWTDTKSALEDLRSHYGGFLRTRAGAIGSPIYLDWMNHYFNPNTVTQKIEVGKNVLDISNITEIDNVFTAIIPIGRRNVAKSDTGNSSSRQDNLYIDGKVLRVPDIVPYFDAKGVSLDSGYHTRADYLNAVNKYGTIIKTVSLTDSTTKEKLYDDACEWIRNNYQGEVTKFTIKALDMHMIEDITGQPISKIMVGDRVTIIYPVGKEDGTFEKRTTVQTCLSITYDLYHPENTSYTFGIPANILTKTYGIRKKTGSVNSASTQKNTVGGYAPPRDKDWLDVAGGWLMRHLQYYNPPSKNPGGIYYPYPMDDKYAGYMYGSALYDPSAKTLVYAEPGTPVDGKKTWHSSIRSFTNFDYETIEAYHVCEYVLYEYGIDIRTMLEVAYPGMTVDSQGNMTFWKTAFNTVTGQFEKVKSVFAAFGEALSDHLIDYYSPDGEQIHAYMGSDGDWHYYYIDPETHEKVETTVRDLQIEQIYDDKRIGWVVKENGQGDFEFADPGAIRLSVENLSGGQLVVAEVTGEVMKLGNYKTQTFFATSVNHMSQVCGDVEYVTDTSVPGDKRMVIHSGGGIRTWHAVKKKDGSGYETDAQGRIKYAEFGLYDNNTLTGGMIVDHLADGSVVNTISGDIVNLNANNSFTTVVGRVNDIQQSTIWQTRDNITGFVGEFEFQGTGANRKLVVKNGGGIDITRNGVQFGLYHEGNLDGGVVVEKINDNSVTTTIKGERVNIQANQVKVGSTSNVQAWLTQNHQDIEQTSGLLADTITAYNAKFHTIETDYLKTGLLETTIASIPTLRGISASFSGNVVTSSALIGSQVYVGNSAPYTNISNGIAAVQVAGPTNNVYTLQYKRFSDSQWQDATGTFSRAVTSWTDTWNTNNGSITVKVSPQNQSHLITTNLRLEGTGQYSNFDAAIGTLDSSGNFTRKYKKDIYLTLDSTGSTARVSARATNSVTGTQYASISVANVWSNGYDDGDAAGYTRGYNDGLPSGISIGSLSNVGTTTPSDATQISALNQGSIWSSFPNTYGYLTFPVTVHGKTKKYYFSFDNRKLASGGNTAYAAGYSAGKSDSWSDGYTQGWDEGVAWANKQYKHKYTGTLYVNGTISAGNGSWYIK